MTNAKNEVETLERVEGGNLGQALLAECRRRKISQAAAARDYFGVHRQAFSEWVNGRRRIPYDYAAELARFLRINVSEARELMTRPYADRITVAEGQLVELETRVAHLEDQLAEVLRLLKTARAKRTPKQSPPTQ